MLFVNDILEEAQSGSKFRIINLHVKSGDLWLFDLSGKNSTPKFSTVEETELDISLGKLKLAPGTPARPPAPPSKAAIAARDRAYELIKPLIADEALLCASSRNALINQRASEMGCSPQTLFSHLRKWWSNGQTRNALLPKFSSRGSTSGDTSNRGRPPKYLDYTPFQVTAADKSLIKQMVESMYLNNEAITLADTYQALLDEHYSYTDSEGALQLKAEGEIPSDRQFRRVVQSEFPREQVIRRRKGDSTYERDHRPKLGSLQLETYTVGDTYEIDATIVDAFLVSSRNRAAIIGKPTLYLIVDRRSWLIVGFYIGLENPSWSAARQAILSIAEDKEVLCNRYGVPYDPCDWPAHGILPKTIVCDRGSEVLGKNSNRLAENLDVTVLNLPSKRADQKPHVECGFKLIQRPLATIVPGYEPPENVKKRQGKHYERDACLTLDEMTSIMLKSIIQFNRTVRNGYRQSAEQTLAGFQPMPLDIWNYEIRERAGALSRFTAEHIRFELLPTEKATVTREGVQLGGCYYSSPEIIRKGWFDTADARGTFKVTVSHDPRLIDSIYVHDPMLSPEGFFVASLLDKCRDYRGLSAFEVAAIEYQREKLRKESMAGNRQVRFELNQFAAPIAERALAETRKVTKGKSRTSRKASIVDVRQDELRIERQEKARVTPVDATTPTNMADVISFVPATPPKTPSAQATGDPIARRRLRLQEMLNGN